jgi:hypothetical protein
MRCRFRRRVSTGGPAAADPGDIVIGVRRTDPFIDG